MFSFLLDIFKLIKNLSWLFKTIKTILITTLRKPVHIIPSERLSSWSFYKLKKHLYLYFILPLKSILWLLNLGVTLKKFGISNKLLKMYFNDWNKLTRLFFTVHAYINKIIKTVFRTNEIPKKYSISSSLTLLALYNSILYYIILI